MGGGGGGAGQNLTEKCFVNCLVSNVATVGSTSSTCIQWDQLSIFKENCTLRIRRGSNIFQGWGRSQLLIPYRTCDFQGESEPPVPPASSLGPCMTDPSQNDHVLIMSYV